MAMKGELAPIIIKKIKKGGHGHHGGSWKVAYADFVTAMMALFIVLWVLAQQDKAKEAVSLYFTEPNLTPEEIKMRLEHPALPSSKIKMKPPKKDEKYQSFKQEHKKLKELAKKIQARLEGLKWFKSMKGQLLIEVTDEGLRIEFLDAANAPFFDVGSPMPKSVTVQALSEMAAEIRKVPNPVAIEGHTDSRPFLSASYGNWELSADRANAARRILETGGVSHIAEVRGLADVKLRDPAHPFSDSNRRVSLIVRHTLDSHDKPTELEEKPKILDEKTRAAAEKTKESVAEEVKIKPAH